MSVRKSLAWSLSSRYLLSVVKLSSILILARLLTPEEVGIFGIALSITAMGQALREFGVSNFLVQEKDLSDSVYRSAVGIMLVLGCLMGGLLLLSAEHIADWYGEPNIAYMISILSVGYFILPFVAPSLAVKRRAMDFKSVAIAETASGLIVPILSVLFVTYGLGYIGLAWANFAGVIALFAFTSVQSPERVFVLPSFVHWRRIWAFGWKSSLQAIVSSSRFYMSDIILGKLLGFAQAGLFSRAMGLIQLVNANFWGGARLVVMSNFAEYNRNGKSLDQPYLLGASILTGIGWPGFAFVMLMSEHVFLILFGSQWGEAAPLARILCIGVLIHLPWWPAAPLLVATGRIDSLTKVVLISQCVYVVLMIAAAMHELSTVPFSFVAFSIVASILYQRQVESVTGITYRTLLTNLKGSAVVTLCTLVIPSVLLSTRTIEHSILDIGVWMCLIGALLGWLLGVFLVKHELWFELQRHAGKLRKARNAGD